MQKQKGKRQFKGTTKPKEHYDRKIVRTGYTISLSMGKLIPHDWQYVRVQKIEETATHIIIKITKLIGANNNAQAPPTHKASKRNT